MPTYYICGQRNPRDGKLCQLLENWRASCHWMIARRCKYHFRVIQCRRNVPSLRTVLPASLDIARFPIDHFLLGALGEFFAPTPSTGWGFGRKFTATRWKNNSHDNKLVQRASMRKARLIVSQVTTGLWNAWRPREYLNAHRERYVLTVLYYY